MDKAKIKEHISKINEKFNNQDYKKCYELIKHLASNSTYSLNLLRIKIRCEEALTRYDDALKSINMILFLIPNDLESHKAKIRILKKLQQFNNLSESLVVAKTLFPNLSLTD